MVFLNLDTGENDSTNVAVDGIQFAAFQHNVTSLVSAFGTVVGYPTRSNNNAVELAWLKEYFFSMHEDYIHLDWISHVIGDFFIKINEIGGVNVVRDQEGVVIRADIYLKSSNSPEISVYADEEDEGASLRKVLEILNE